MAKRPYVLSIAGIDPSAGAGLLADIKTFEQLKVYGLGIPTANTIQTEDGFFANQWLPSSFVIEGVKKMISTYPIAVVKIGIIEDQHLLEEMTTWIKNQKPETKIVWDPVLKSSTQFQFQENWKMRRTLLMNIDVMTPNKDEWEKLQIFLEGHSELAVVVKGGHNTKNKGYDLLHHEGKQMEIPPQTELPVKEKHGSGCVYSSALAAYMAKGEELLLACEKAKTYTEKFLASNDNKLGYHYGEAPLYIAR